MYSSVRDNTENWSYILLNGQLVKKQNLFSNRTEINILNELSGVYFVQVKEDNKLILSTKILKE